MALCKTYRPYTRLEHFELDGLLSVLDREIAQRGEDGEADTLYYEGVHDAISIIRYHEFVDTQDDFMRLLARLHDEREGGDRWE